MQPLDVQCNASRQSAVTLAARGVHWIGDVGNSGMLRSPAQGVVQHSGVGNVLAEGGFLRERLARALLANPLGGDATGLLVEARGRSGTQVALQLSDRKPAQVRHGAQAEPLQDWQGSGADAAQDADRLRPQEVQDLLGAHHDQTVGSVEIRGNLGHQLVGPNANRGGQPHRGADGALDQVLERLGWRD